MSRAVARREERVGAIELPAVHRARAVEVCAVCLDGACRGLGEAAERHRGGRADEVEQLARERIEQRTRVRGSRDALRRLVHLLAGGHVEEARGDLTANRQRR